jgi:hypothetical protein
LSAGFTYPGEDRDKAMRGRDVIRENLTPAQVAEAEQRADDWFATLMQQPDNKKYGLK